MQVRGTNKYFYIGINKWDPLFARGHKSHIEMPLIEGLGCTALCPEPTRILPGQRTMVIVIWWNAIDCY